MDMLRGLTWVIVGLAVIGTATAGAVVYMTVPSELDTPVTALEPGLIGTP